MQIFKPPAIVNPGCVLVMMRALTAMLATVTWSHHSCEVTFASGVPCAASRALAAGGVGARCKRRIVWRSDATLVARTSDEQGPAHGGNRRRPVMYVIGDILSSFLYEGYSYLDQAISELGAFGSPVRPFMVTVILIHGLLVLTFGVGVLRATHRRSLSSVVAF